MDEAHAGNQFDLDQNGGKKKKTRPLMIPFVPFPKTPSLSHNIIWRVEGQGTRPLTNRLGGDKLPWALQYSE